MKDAVFQIRPISAGDGPALLAVWERSVRATHTFLQEDDITFFRPRVAEFLVGGADHKPIGFVGIGDHAIDALFIDPAYRGRGGGRRLVMHAQMLVGGVLAVDVNEQNTAAPAFYARNEFEVLAVVDDHPAGHQNLLLRKRLGATS